MPIKPNIKVNEDSSCRLTFQLTDYDGTGIEPADLLTATMTLKDKETNTVINSRNAIDVSGYFSASGNFSFELVAADNAIQNSDTHEETHVATFSFTSDVGGNSISLVEEIYITVINLRGV